MSDKGDDSYLFNLDRKVDLMTYTLSPSKNYSLQPEYRSVMWIENVPEQFTKSGKLLLDHFAGTFAT